MLTPYCCPWKMSQSSICHNYNSAPSVLNPVHPGLHSRATSNSIGESYCAHLRASRMGLQSHFRVHWWVLLCSTLCIQAGTAEPFQSPLMSPTVLNSVHPGWDSRATSESFDESYCAQLCACRLRLQSHLKVQWWVHNTITGNTNDGRCYKSLKIHAFEYSMLDQKVCLKVFLFHSKIVLWLYFFQYKLCNSSKMFWCCSGSYCTVC